MEDLQGSAPSRAKKASIGTPETAPERGALLLLGLLTRLAAIPLMVTMLVAIVTTKVPILLGHAYWGLQLRELSSYGFWSMAHESRTDFAMLLGATFLLIIGAGSISLDAMLTRRRQGWETR